MPNQNDMQIKRYRMPVVECCTEREELIKLAQAGDLAQIKDRILKHSDEFQSCPCCFPPNTSKGDWCKVSEVAEAFQACANREAEKDSLIAALRQRVEQSGVANMQLAGAIATRDAEIADLRAQVQIERGIAERMRKEAP